MTAKENMGNMIKAAAIFSILMGASLLATWVVLFAVGQVPELSTSPFKTTLLLFAEALTGLSLIVGGYGLLTSCLLLFTFPFPSSLGGRRR